MQYETSYRGNVSMLRLGEWRATRRAGRAEPDGLREALAQGGGLGLRTSAAIGMVEPEEQEPERWDGLA
jgi:hypothetical protein